VLISAPAAEIRGIEGPDGVRGRRGEEPIKLGRNVGFNRAWQEALAVITGALNAAFVPVS
jgi:hypothetical protein